MAIPPPYSPSAPKKNNTVMVVVIVFAVLAVCCLGGLGLGGYGLFKGYQAVAPMMECGINFEAARDAVVAYSKANNGMLPKAENWEDAVRPHFGQFSKETQEVMDVLRLKSPQPAGPWGCSQPSGKPTGMAFNKELSGKKMTEIEDGVPLLFEVPESGHNLNQVYKKLADNTGPILTGDTKRPWIVIPVRGDMKLGDDKFSFEKKNSISIE